MHSPSALPLAALAATLLGLATPVVRAQQPGGTTALAVAPPSTAVLPLDRIVAVVGDALITQSTVQERVLQKRQEGVQIPTDSAGFARFVGVVVNELVDEELLLAKARDLKITVPDADVTATVDKQYKSVRGQFASDAEFRSALQKAGYGAPDEYKRFLGDQIRRTETITRTVRKLREDGKIVPANITDAEVAESFERNKASLPRREASVAWRQIIIAPRASAEAKARARARAESLLVELKDGGDFEKVARRESNDPGSREQGGDLGWNRRGKMVPEFDRWMFALPPGQLSPVVETAFGYHIIRVDRAQPAEVKARHILITPRIDSSDVARAKEEADSVLAAWRRGAPFDSLAKAHHDYRGGEETTLLTPYPRAQLPAAYQQGFADRKAGEFAEFALPGNANAPVKYVVARIASVEEGGELTLAEVRERFRQRLADEGGIKRLMEQLRKQTYVSIRTDALLQAAPAPQ